MSLAPFGEDVASTLVEPGTRKRCHYIFPFQMKRNSPLGLCKKTH